MMPELRLAYPTAQALQADHDQNLRKGRAFVPGATGPAERAGCRVVLVHPDGRTTLTLDAEVVWVKRDDPGRGVGVQFKDPAPMLREQLRAFAHFDGDGSPFAVQPPPAPAAPAPAAPAAPGAAAPAPGTSTPATAAEAEAEAERAARNVHERVRQLNAHEREILARTGAMPERVALERAFGGGVWEPLLSNPTITPQEIARIAKNGGLPRHLVTLIAGNGGWIANSEVQRAMLGNPRVGGRELERVLRAMPRTELERAATQTSYRADVRSTAKRLLGKD